MSSSDSESSSSSEEERKPPQAKRIKYAKSGPVSMEPLTDKPDRRYDLKTTFIVDVGTEPRRECFTVHHDILTQRSEFFRTARSPELKKPNKPSRLDDDDPAIFAVYLHCEYFGAEDLVKRIETDVEEDWVAEEEASTPEDVAKSKNCSAMKVFISLYILADKLLDPITANLVIDELIAFSSKQLWTISSASVARIYTSTTNDSPLRKLARDWYIPDNDFS